MEKKGAIVNVSDGYARNMILPKKLGVEATPKNLNDLKLQKANAEKVAQENLESAQAFAKDLETKEIILTLKVGEGGKNFRICIFQRNFRSSQSSAWAGY